MHLLSPIIEVGWAGELASVKGLLTLSSLLRFRSQALPRDSFRDRLTSIRKYSVDLEICSC